MTDTAIALAECGSPIVSVRMSDTHRITILTPDGPIELEPSQNTRLAHFASLWRRGESITLTSRSDQNP